MMAGGIAAIGWCVWYLTRAIGAGQTVGRWGVHPAGSLVYVLSICGACLGVVLAMACISLGWRWFAQGSSKPP